MGSLQSEEWVFSQLNLTKDTCIRTERQLLCEFTCPVPEGIWTCPTDSNKRISVEVKRVIGNWLPLEHANDYRRTVKRRDRIIWPWKSTVEGAITKAESDAIQSYMVDVHYAVFVIPESLDVSHQNKVRKHIYRIASAVTVHKKPKVSIIILRGPDSLFYRF